MYTYQTSLSLKYHKSSSLFNYSCQSPIVNLFWLHQKLPSCLDILYSCLNRCSSDTNSYFHHCQMHSTLGWINLDDRIMFLWLQFSQKSYSVMCPPTWLLIDYILTPQSSSPSFPTQYFSKLNLDKKLHSKNC